MRHHHSDDQDIGHRVLGALLSLALGVGFFHYGNHSTVSILALNELSRDIWPDQWWPGWNLSREAINTLLLSKWIVALVGCVFFFVNLPKWGALSLFFGVVIQLAVYSIDRRTMGNYHFMPLLMATAYLFFPRKIALTAWLMACFYLGAGLLKLNSEWLSGSAFPRHWFDPSLRSYLYGSGLWLFQTGTHFVVLLELSLVFLLFSSIRLVRWTALSLFVLFHGLSYLAVGWFYPLVMALLLPVFPVYWANRPWDQNSSQKRPTRGGLGFLAVFLLLQLLPLFLEKDPALSRKYGLFSLNMFDSNPDCVGRALIRKEQRSFWIRLEDPMLAVRIQCEPYLLQKRAERWCESMRGEGRIFLQAKRSNEIEYGSLLQGSLSCGAAP